MAQSLADQPALSAAWQARLAETWVPVDKDLCVAYPARSGDPSFRFDAISGLPGYLSGNKILRDLAPVSSQRLDGFFLTAPHAVRGLQDAAVETQAGQDWLRLGCHLYRPVSALAPLAPGRAAVAIDAAGQTEWRSLPATGRIAVTGAIWWYLHDASFQELASGPGDGGAAFSGTGAHYGVVFGAPLATVALDLS